MNTSKLLELLLAKPWEWNDETVGSLFSSLVCMLIILIAVIIVNIKARFVNPLKKPKGLMFFFETGVNFFDGMASDLMGPSFKNFGGYIFVISCYLFLAFIFGLTGLPSPMTNLSVPLSLGLMTFVLIHATSIRYTKWKYFKRYVDPLPFFLPINLLSMWAPLLSLTFRLFGNALAGWTLMSVVYYALESLSQMIFGFISSPEGLNTIFIAPFITPILHAYFDLFSAFIQTAVFIMLTMLFVANEVPDEEDIKEKLAV